MVDQEEIHRKCNSDDPQERLDAISQLYDIFEYIPDKKLAWQDLHRLTSDEEQCLRQEAAIALGFVFKDVPDKQQAWQDLRRLTLDEGKYVRLRAEETLQVIFKDIPDKQQAWKDLVRLTSDEYPYLRLEATKVLGIVFKEVPDEQQVWEDLHRLASDEDKDVRREIAGVFGIVFKHIPDKERAWEDLHILTSDKDIDVRVGAYHSFGRISIYKASQSESEDEYLEELEKAIEFFEKSAKESNWWHNPSSFCLPFYRSFYAIVYAKKREAKNEVEKYLSEAKNEIYRSENKKLLFEAVENLANALKEVQNLENLDLEAKKGELDFYRKYCEQASELMRNTEETVPYATAIIRKGLPILDRKLKSLLKEIQEKAKTACRESQGTATEEIARAINRKVQGWKAGTEEEIALDAEELLIYMKSNVPRFPENEHIFETIIEIENKKDLNLLLRSIPDLLKELPKIMIDPERMKPTIGIITALSKEYAAVNILLENKNDNYKIPGPGAGRRYCLGEISSEEGNKHNVVLANAGMGNNIAATKATLLLEHFPNVKSIIMVGIAGGVPNIEKVDDHVRLGDIVVSNEYGVIQYDNIKKETQRIIFRNPPRPPCASLLEAAKYLEAGELLGKSLENTY